MKVSDETEIIVINAIGLVDAMVITSYYCGVRPLSQSVNEGWFDQNYPGDSQSTDKLNGVSCLCSTMVCMY